MEEWRDIEGYEGKYKISNLGRVKSLKFGKEKILKHGKLNSGYLYVNLHKEGKPKRCYVHRLVASAFIQNPSNYKEVNHKDENKVNNIFTNLEWCDRKYNCNYGKRNEKISKPVRCLETGVFYPSARDAQRETGIAFQNISKCCNGKLKTAGKLHWQFL